jgi:ribonucleoside-diphosphate reductase alpha chain
MQISAVPSGRKRLPNRRPHELIQLEHAGFQLTVGVGRYTDGKLAELFVDTHKTGTTLDTLLKDSAILLSVALQYGADAASIRSALSPTGALAAALTRIEG